MDDHDRLRADYAGMGLTIGPHPMALRRDEMALRGVLRASDLPQARDGRRVRVAGMVITRQRPGTAKGFVFLTLEDETGISNVIVRPDLFDRERMTVIRQPFLLVEGVLQHQDGVLSVGPSACRGSTAARRSTRTISTEMKAWRYDRMRNVLNGACSPSASCCSAGAGLRADRARVFTGGRHVRTGTRGGQRLCEKLGPPDRLRDRHHGGAVETAALRRARRRHRRHVGGDPGAREGRAGSSRAAASTSRAR